MTLEINEKALQELAKAHLSRITQNFQHEVDQLSQTMKGQPPQTIQAGLEKRAKSVGLSDLNQQELARWAQIIADGGQIEFLN